MFRDMWEMKSFDGCFNFWVYRRNRTQSKSNTLKPIKTGAVFPKNQSQLEATLSRQSIAGKSAWHQPLPSAGKPLHAKISFCFTSDWSRIWLETLKPITKRSGETIYLHPFWLTKSITLVWVVRHLTENWSWPYWLYWHKVSVNNRMCLWRFSCVFWIILQLVDWPILFFSV